MSNAAKKKRKPITETSKQSKREYAVRYYAERDYRKDDGPGSVAPGDLKKNWKHIVTYSMSEGDLAQKLETSVTYIRYLRRKVAICQKHGVTDPAQIYKLSGGVGEKTLKAYFEAKGGATGSKKTARSSTGKTASKAAKKSAKKSGKKSAKKTSKKSAKKSASTSKKSKKKARK